MTDLLSRAVTTYSDEGAITFGRKALLFTYRETMQAIYNRYWDIRYGPGVSILEKDWDNLLLLDAARYDEFVRVAPIDEESVERRITVGSKTPEFLHRTFDNVRLHDTVYITANPQPLKYQYETDKKVFYKMISLLDQWDPEIQTIRPEIVRKVAIDTAKTYPDKRLIIHFLQPHAPFLGPTASAISKRTGKTIGGLNPGREYTSVESKNIQTATYEDILREGVNQEEIRAAYRETLELVVNECQQLVSELSGKSAITSDHGELLGERIFPFGPQRWEHPEGIRTSGLCMVPWVEFERDGRKQVTAELPQEDQSTSQEVIENRLHSLGYK